MAPFGEKVAWFKARCKKLRVPYETAHHKVPVRRSHLLVDAFDQFEKLRKENLKNQRTNHLHRIWRFQFVGEPGLDAGGLAREFFTLLTENLFNADVGLFRYSGAGTLSYQINEASGMANGELHRQYFHFAGRVLGKALSERVRVADGDHGHWGLVELLVRAGVAARAKPLTPRTP